MEAISSGIYPTKTKYEPVLEEAKKIPQSGNLMMNMERSPIVYVSLDAETLYPLFEKLTKIPVEGAVKPFYWEKGIGAHITVFNTKEITSSLSLFEEYLLGIEEKINFTVARVLSIKPKFWRPIEKAWIVEVFSEELEEVRKSHGFSKFPNNHPFHITFATRYKPEFQHLALKTQLEPTRHPMDEFPEITIRESRIPIETSDKPEFQHMALKTQLESTWHPEDEFPEITKKIKELVFEGCIGIGLMNIEMRFNREILVKCRHLIKQIYGKQLGGKFGDIDFENIDFENKGSISVAGFDWDEMDRLDKILPRGQSFTFYPECIERILRNNYWEDYFEWKIIGSSPELSNFRVKVLGQLPKKTYSMVIGTETQIAAKT